MARTFEEWWAQSSSWGYGPSEETDIARAAWNAGAVEERRAWNRAIGRVRVLLTDRLRLSVIDAILADYEGVPYAVK